MVASITASEWLSIWQWSQPRVVGDTAGLGFSSALSQTISRHFLIIAGRPRGIDTKGVAVQVWRVEVEGWSRSLGNDHTQLRSPFALAVVHHLSARLARRYVPCDHP